MSLRGNNLQRRVTYIVPLVIFVLLLSTTSLPGLVYGDPVPTNGTSPATQWVPAGPASDTIRYQMYTSDSAELNAMCVGQVSTCVPQLDLSDVPIPGSALSPASGCTANCAITDSRFWVTAPTQQLGQLQVDFNLANTFWGITFCNGKDGVTLGAVVCPDAPGGGNIAANCAHANPANDCTTAAINIRQGIASLIDKVAFTVADEGSIGPNAAPMDNPLTPASNVLHSGYPNDINHPNIPPGVCDSSGIGAGCNPVGPYCITPGASGSLSNGNGNQAVACSSLGAVPIGGVCSWDTIAKCRPTTPISAFHYANDATDSLGFVTTGQPDFCRAAQHFINAGLATGMNAQCELTGEFAPLSGGSIVFYGRNSLGRHNLSVGLTAAICELVNLGSTSCTQVSLTIISLVQAHPLVFTTGCKSATEPGCQTVGPNTGWNMYAGGFFFPTPVPNNEWALYDSTFASDFCGGQPGLEPANYDFVCNAKHDTYAEQSQFLSTPAAAEASLQVAMDIFGNRTFNIPIWTPSVQYPYLKGWNGIGNAAGIGTAQGNPWSLLNAWNANPAVAGPTIRWGQKDASASLNPFNFNTVVEADIVSEVYDALLITNPFSPTQIIGWMVNSYSLIPAGGFNCPTSYTNARGTFAVGACVKMLIRGDIPFHDIYNCASSNAVCLTSHIVTANDVKFSFANYNATGGLVTPSTANTIDVVYNPNQLPAAAYGPSGGTEGAGITETFFIYLHNLNAWALNDIAGVPIVPQRLWVTQTAPVQSNGVYAPCLNLGTPSCTVDPAFTGGVNSDPILAQKFIGSGPFVCSSGPLGVSGTVIGGGCTFNADGSSGSQAIPVGGTAILRRFSGANGLDSNLAYYRSNAKFLQFQWAAYPSGTAATTGGIISAINACKANSDLVGGVVSYAACQHWNSPSAGLVCTSTAGPCIGVAAGGHGTLPGNFGPVVTQLGQWIGRGQWTFGVPSFAALAGAQAIPQTMYEDGSVEGSFAISSSSNSVSTTAGTQVSVTIQVSLSGGPDNNFTGTVPVTLTTVQSPTGVTASLSPSSISLTPANPSASAILTLSATLHGASTSVSCNPVSLTIGSPTVCTATVTSTPYTVLVKASSPNFPSVTSTITLVITPPALIPRGTVSFTSDSSGTFINSQCTLSSSGTCQVSYTPNSVGTTIHTIRGVYSGDTSYSTSSGHTTVLVTKASSTTNTVVFVESSNSFHDTATVTGVTGTIPSGTLVYNFFSNSVCTGNPLTSQTVTLTTSGAVPDSSSTGVLAPGFYGYQAIYSGDANYSGSTAVCELISV